MSSTAITSRHNGNFQALVPYRSQKISVSGTSAQSNALQSGTTLVRIFCTTDAWLAFGSNPTAVANDGLSYFLPAGIQDFIGVTGSTKIAVIQDSTSGSLHITEAL